MVIPRVLKQGWLGDSELYTHTKSIHILEELEDIHLIFGLFLCGLGAVPAKVFSFFFEFQCNQYRKSQLEAYCTLCWPMVVTVVFVPKGSGHGTPFHSWPWKWLIFMGSSYPIYLNQVQVEELSELRFTLTTALESLQLGGRLIVVTLRRKEVFLPVMGVSFWSGFCEDFVVGFVWLGSTYSSDMC